MSEIFKSILTVYTYQGLKLKNSFVPFWYQSDRKLVTSSKFFVANLKAASV